MISQPLDLAAQGKQAAPDLINVLSSETYVGFERTQNFAAQSGIVPDQPHDYGMADHLALNQWSLAGNWTVKQDSATANLASARIALEFHARDLHLVLGPSATGKPVRFRVLLDGVAPAGNHGEDIDAGGNGIVGEHRLYQLIRQNQPIQDRKFTIEFLDPGVQAFAFTFG